MLLLTGQNPEKVSGFPIYFPDTAFFMEGKVSDIIKTDKDGFLTS